MAQPFYLFSNLHFEMILGCLLCLAVVIFYARQEKTKQYRQRDIWIFTLVFLCIEMALVGSKVIAKEWSVEQNLPLHLCDISAMMILYALFSKSKRAFELGYYWGTVGGLMGIMTPNLQTVNWYFVPFFVWHLFLICGPFYQLLVDRFTLSYRSIYETLGITVALALVMMGFNHFLGSNYMFVNQKISSLDALGLPDWPNYLPYLTLIALVMFHIFWGISILVRKK